MDLLFWIPVLLLLLASFKEDSPPDKWDLLIGDNKYFIGKTLYSPVGAFPGLS
jgi:hypothetical protein